MKPLEELAKKMATKKPYLKEKYNVKSIGIFGSYSRKEATDKSDLDILVEFDKPIGLAFVDLADELEEILGVKADLVSKKGIKQKYLQRIEKEIVNV